MMVCFNVSSLWCLAEGCELSNKHWATPAAPPLLLLLQMFPFQAPSVLPNEGRGAEGGAWSIKRPQHVWIYGACCCAARRCFTGWTGSVLPGGCVPAPAATGVGMSTGGPPRLNTAGRGAALSEGWTSCWHGPTEAAGLCWWVTNSHSLSLSPSLSLCLLLISSLMVRGHTGHGRHSLWFILTSLQLTNLTQPLIIIQFLNYFDVFI